MRITISGKAGSGKSTVAKLLSEKLNLRHYSIGDLMRAIADEKGLNLLELNKICSFFLARISKHVLVKFLIVKPLFSKNMLTLSSNVCFIIEKEKILV